MSESAPAPQVAEAPAQYGVVPQGQVLVDSGPLLALFNGADHWHARVVAWLQAHPALALVSTWPVLTEVCALLARRVHNQAALSYLGLGTQPPQPSWGRMLAEAQTLMFQSPLLAVWPGVAIALSVLGLNLLGDGLRDLLDPRLQRRS